MEDFLLSLSLSNSLKFQMQLVVIPAERLGTLCDEVRRMDVQAYTHIKKKEERRKA